MDDADKHKLAADAAFCEMVKQGFVPKHACDEIKFYWALCGAIDIYIKENPAACAGSGNISSTLSG